MKLMSQIVSAVIVLVVTTAGAAAAGSPGRPAPAPPERPVYLALGDSVANGEQSAPEVAGDYWATVAAWRAHGYVELLADRLRAQLDCRPATPPHAGRPGCPQLQLVNLARSAVPAMDGRPERPGVTSALLVDEQLPAATELLQRRNHDRNPQNDVEVVTLTVGGNDIFDAVVAACWSGPSAACSTAIATSFATFAASYTTILTQLRQAAGPATPIVTTTYYDPLPFCVLGAADPVAARSFGDAILETAPVPGLGAVGFNGLIEAISAQHGATVADTFGTLGAGDLVGGTDCLHPNAAGHATLAAVVDTAVLGALRPH